MEGWFTSLRRQCLAVRSELSAATRAHLVSFGPYQFDLKTAELHKNGYRIHLQPQPARVLALLLGHAGELVTREEIQEEIWGNEVFVDFEKNLNFAVKQIREALGDDAEKPAYIETLPKRGYRFIAPVEGLVSRAALETPGAPVVRTKRLIAIVAAVAVALALVVVLGWRVFFAPPLLGEKDVILLAHFVNKTGDPLLDGSLKTALLVKLEESPFLNLASEQEVQDTLQMMKRKPDELLTGAVALEVCQRKNAKALVASEIAALGNQYVLSLSAIACQDGRALARVQEQVPSKEAVLGAVGRAGVNLRRKLGESLATIQKFDKPLEEATTLSLEALQQLTLGLEMVRRGRAREAIPHYERAIELDPNFASAYRALGIAYENLRQGEKLLLYITKAFELRNRVSEHERLAISGTYYLGVTRELEKARETLELFHRTYPRRSMHNNLGLAHYWLGETEKAHEAYREAMQRNPNNSMIHLNLSDSYLTLGKVEQAKAVLEQAIARGLDNMGVHLCLYRIAFLQGDLAAMQRQVEWARGKPGEHSILAAQAAALAYLGKRNESLKLYQRVVEMARQHGSLEPAADYLATAALNEASFGNCPKARMHIDAALAILRSSTTVVETAAYLFARCGDSARAQSFAGELAKRFPLGTWVNNMTLPEIHAILETNRGNAVRAIELLRSAEPFEIGYRVRSTYTRGRAYLKAGSGKDAAAEFQKILARPFAAARPILMHALAYLELGRAYMLAGETEKARKAYQDFLTLWKDADPDIPILLEAKAEYAKLKRRRGGQAGGQK